NNISPQILSLPKIKEINDETFMRKASLVKVKMPDTVEKIGQKAFYECSNLTEIDLSTSLLEVGDYAFAGCTSLLSVDFPSPAERMGNYIFSGCSALSKVVLHEGMKQIAREMFASCRSLQSIELPSTVTYTAYNSFYNTGLREIVLPKVMTEIGQQSFYECDSLSKVTMPESLKAIGPTAFSTTGITEIVLPSDIESIGDQAFAHTKIREVTIPVSLKKLSRNAFGYIPTLKTLIIEDSPEELLIMPLLGTDGYYIEKLHVGRTLTPSEQRDFGFGTKIEDLSFSNFVTDVNMLFSGCTDLKKLVLPESVRSITAEAFANTGLTDVYVMNTTPPTMSENTFSQSTYNTAVLHVKPEVKTDYWLHMYWGQFMNIEGDAISDSGVSAPTADKDCMTVSVAGRSLQVGGIAEDTVVTVYNIAGKIVFRGTGRTVDGLEAGIYIVRAGDLTCKAMIR
ncbi:MAG: leucine-rich repeat domain-containing protein, partial [Muribaculaceae bacterium]|nr:leucine-rich repeat domain-containing protein [Muribaculaceae bacterium]